MLKIEKYIEDKIKIINERLKQLIVEDENSPQNQLFQAANYAIHSGGKRLRPTLIFATAETLQQDTSKVLDIACAMEMIHNYSLIHDDLPCMDNDDFRRNKPSLHKAFGEWQALLTGDFLLSLAFEVIANAQNVSDKQKTEIIKVISKQIGGKGMIGGQYVDLLSDENINWNTLQFIDMHKTSSLFVASLQCGAILANANEKEMTALTKFGEHLGLAFQIVDDILDYSKEGKSKDKVNSVSVLGMDNAKEKVKQLYERGILYLSALPYPPPLLKDLAFKLVRRSF